MSATRPLEEARERDEPLLEFKVAPDMPYPTRMRWVAGLAVVGIVLQVAFLNVLFGLPLLVAALALSWVVGFGTRLDRRALVTDAAWRRVEWERVRAIVDLDRDMKRWDQSALDVSNPLGCATLVVALLFVAVLTIVTVATLGPAAALIVVVDGALLIAAQWLSGMRRIHRRPELVLKADHMDEVVDRLRRRIDDEGELHGQLLLREHVGGDAPVDARLLIEIRDAPCELLLVQGQVVLNRVQGTPHPYFYCVVIATSGAGLSELTDIDAPKGVTVERKIEKDVDVVVIRQRTTKTSGYHTKPDVSRRLLATALDVASDFRGASPPLTS